jgi:DNA-directed RNA polymerase specialized sigma24 family protein
MRSSMPSPPLTQHLLAPGFWLLAPSLLNSSNSSDSIPGLNAPTAYDYVQALYRLLVVQTGSSSAAESAVEEIFLKAFEDADRQLERLDFDGLFRTVFRNRNAYPRQAEPELNGWARKLHQLPEPERFSMTLFYLEILPPATIADITGTTLDTLAERVAKARKELNYHLS